jgi:hypothetical protein
MNAPVSGHQANLFFEHLTALRRYAERVFVDDEALSFSEEADRAARMQEFIAVGLSCEFNEKQLVTLLLGGLF